MEEKKRNIHIPRIIERRRAFLFALPARRLPSDSAPNHFRRDSRRNDLPPRRVVDEKVFNGRLLLQVKVWFQNRRTKHKRMQQEEEAKTHQGSNGSKGSGTPSSAPGQQNNQHHVTKWKQETSDGGPEGSAGEYGEYIDMDMEDDCASDVDSET